MQVCDEMRRELESDERLLVTCLGDYSLRFLFPSISPVLSYTYHREEVISEVREAYEEVERPVVCMILCYVGWLWVRLILRLLKE